MKLICIGCRPGRCGLDRLCGRKYSVGLFSRKIPHAHVSFVVLRYSGFLSTFAALFLTAAHSDNCQATVAVTQLGAVLVNVSSGIIFGYRVCAMWDGSKKINLIVGFMYLLMVSAWVRLLCLRYNYLFFF